MHGGGFVYPQDPDDDMYCAHIAAATHGIVVDIDYATSWEGPFPLAFDHSRLCGCDSSGRQRGQRRR